MNTNIAFNDVNFRIIFNTPLMLRVGIRLCIFTIFNRRWEIKTFLDNHEITGNSKNEFWT
jgi:hypothetical protein